MFENETADMTYPAAPLRTEQPVAHGDLDPVRREIAWRTGKCRNLPAIIVTVSIFGFQHIRHGRHLDHRVAVANNCPNVLASVGWLDVRPTIVTGPMLIVVR